MKIIKLDQKGAIQFIVLAILLAGIIGGIFLITQGNPLKLFTRATTPSIVFKATDGSSLPKNASGVSVSSSKTVRVELTSPLGPPAGVGPSVPVSGPNNRRTVSYKIAEDPTGLNSATSQPYTTEPTVINYTFKDPSLGQKFLWVEFRASDGSIDRRTAQIEIVSPSTSGPIPPPSTPTPTPVPTQAPAPGGGGGGGGGSRPAPTAAPRTIAQFRYAESVAELSSANWNNYAQGIAVTYEFKDTTLGQKFIFVQFRDNQNQIVQINGQDYISSSIELVAQGAPAATPSTEGEVTVGTATLSTDSTVTQRGGNWGADYINLTLSGFSTPGRSIAGLFIKNTVGQCSINDCGYIGWTQIRSYGTNGTDTTPWTAPSSLSSGVHMFGVFSLNSNGTAGKLLAVSATNFTTSSSSCQANVTPCSCGDRTVGRTDDPGKCYPECTGGWCNGGTCVTCNP